MQITKLEIARRQLETAIDLHFSGGDYLAVITLAGAAEEILGTLLRRRGESAMIDDLIELDKELTGGRPFEQICQEVNGVRNSLKHANKPDEDNVFIAQGEAVAMLARALANYLLFAKSATPSMMRAHDHFMMIRGLTAPLP